MPRGEAAGGADPAAPQAWRLLLQLACQRRLGLHPVFRCLGLQLLPSAPHQVVRCLATPPPQRKPSTHPSLATTLPAPCRTGTYFCMDLSVTAVVIKGLAEHKDELGAPLCPCRHYDDKAAEAEQGYWNCPCVPMRERKVGAGQLPPVLCAGLCWEAIDRREKAAAAALLAAAGLPRPSGREDRKQR